MSSSNNRRRVARRSEPVAAVKEPQKQNARLVGRVAPSSKNTPLSEKDKAAPVKPSYVRPQSGVNNRRSYSASKPLPQSQQGDEKSANKPSGNVNNRPRAVSAIQKVNGPSTNSKPRSNSAASKPTKATASKPANESESKLKNNKVQGVSYIPNKESVVLPNVAHKPPMPNKPRNSPSSKPANGVAKRTTDNKDQIKRQPVTAIVAPMQSQTVKPQKLGHNFLPHELTEWVTWCDACGSIILSIGMFGKCVSCEKCKMVCHVKCAQTVSLTCEADETRSLKADSKVMEQWCKTIVQETDESTLKEYNTIKRVLSKDELTKRITEFNQTVKGSQQMTVLEDGETFRGFIRVHINLSRPVSVGDSNKTLNSKDKLRRSSSFYIDKGAVKALYLSSTNTSEEVIEALLKKYSIRDNVQKFALFEKQVRDGEHIIHRKMLPRERPLFLRLLWQNGSSQNHAFILQENETREIHWETFSPAELNTFLKILTKEEDDHRKIIEARYEKQRTVILRAIQYQKQKKK